MLTKTETKFAIIFLLLLAAELICGSVESLSKWHFITKPLLLISLILYFFVQSKLMILKTRIMILMALTFSLMGDIFLMFVAQSPNYFMLGLIFFFLAHVFYCIVFCRDRHPKTNPIGPIIVLTFYAFGLFYVLKNNLGHLLIPVIFYIIIILFMVITAFLRQRNVSQKSFILVFIGAILFVISDTILALNKFYMPLPFSSISIMLTYGLAQFFIVSGLLKHR